MRLTRERIAQENDAMYLLCCNKGANLLVAAKRTRHHGLNVEAERLIDERPRRTRRNEVEFCKQFLVFASGEIRQIASVEKRQFGSAEIRQFESIEKSQS